MTLERNFIRSYDETEKECMAWQDATLERFPAAQQECRIIMESF